ncbi:MAG: hypothetical protein WC774_00025 [Candidatus Gracilibacteria bacterium]|jgi:hypothetical protein
MGDIEHVNKVMKNLKNNEIAKQNGYIFTSQLADIRIALEEASPMAVQKIDSIIQGSLPTLKNYKDGKDNQAYTNFLDGIQKYVNAAPKNITKMAPKQEPLSEEAQLSNEIKNTFHYFKK